MVSWEADWEVSIDTIVLPAPLLVKVAVCHDVDLSFLIEPIRHDE
jgi:hypothetical protein